MEQYKYCVMCGTRFGKPKGISHSRWQSSKYCCKECMVKNLSTYSSGRFKKGGKAWNKGKTGWMSAEGRNKIAETQKKYIKNETPEQRATRMASVLASRNANGRWTPPALGKLGADRLNVWKGDKASYNAKHRWIQNRWIKTGACQACGVKPRPFGNRRYGTEWCNLDGEYNRDNKESWKEMCVKCHRKYDRESGNGRRNQTKNLRQLPTGRTNRSPG